MADTTTQFMETVTDVTSQGTMADGMSIEDAISMTSQDAISMTSQDIFSMTSQDILSMTSQGSIAMTNQMNGGQSDVPSFSWQDYLVFVASLVITAAVGLAFSFYKRKDNSSEELLVGSRSMNFFPVALSMVASLFNAVFILGAPADVNYRGIEGAMIFFGWLLVAPVVAHVVIPTFYNMRITSAYEYLERRYNYATRVLGSIVFVVSLIIFLAVVLYAPSLAFSQVSSLSLTMCIVLTGGICTIYTCLGGIKAVVATDSIQMVILFVGLIVLTVLGSIQVGGVEQVWRISKEGGRLDFIDIDPDPRNRHTIWGQIIGQWLIFVGIFFSNQMMIQRYMVVQSLKQAQVALYIVLALACLILILVSLLGLVIFAYYRSNGNGCDPIIQGVLKKGDQIVPFFLMEILARHKGLPGLFTAAVFAAALSSVSSALNSVSAVILEDFIKPGYKAYKGDALPEKYATIFSMGLALLFGGVTIGLSFAAEHFTDKLIESTVTIWSIVGGPLAGIFIMGFFFPWVNSAGAIAGLLVSLVLGLWLGVGGVIHSNADRHLLPFCPEPINSKLPTLPTKEAVDAQEFYEISYAWFGVFSIGTCLIVGNVISLISMPFLSSPDKDPMLYYPYADNCCCCCPEACKAFCRCGIDFDTPTKEPQLTSYIYKEGDLEVKEASFVNPAYCSEMDSTPDRI